MHYRRILDKPGPEQAEDLPGYFSIEHGGHGVTNYLRRGIAGNIRKQSVDHEKFAFAVNDENRIGIIHYPFDKFIGPDKSIHHEFLFTDIFSYLHIMGRFPLAVLDGRYCGRFPEDFAALAPVLQLPLPFLVVVYGIPDVLIYSGFDVDGIYKNIIFTFDIRLLAARHSFKTGIHILNNAVYTGDNY